MDYWISYGLLIEIAFMILLVYGVVMFFRTISNLEEEFKSSFSFVIWALSGVMLQGIIVWVLLFQEVPHDHYLWLLYPIVGLVIGYFIVLSARKSFAVIENSRDFD